MHLRRFLASACLIALVSTPGAKGQDAKPDPEMKSVLDALAELGPKPIPTLTPEEARKQPGAADAVKALLKKQGKGIDPEPVGGVKDIGIPGPASVLPARVYTPKGEGPFPVLVYWHGGGWVIASIDAYDTSCRALCNATGCVVVSCGYRFAPERPYPAAADDAFAAYRWVAANAAAVGGDPGKVAVGGESAGGNLAASVCLMARDNNVPPPVHQLLVYPVTGVDLDTASYKENAEAKPLNKAMMRWFLGHYLGGQVPTAYALPLLAKDFTRLPPATVITAEIDPLRDDGKRFAEVLQQAGGKVRYQEFSGVTHEFFGMGVVVPKAKEAVAVAAQDLKAAFGK